MRTGRIGSRMAANAFSALCDEDLAASQRRADHHRDLWELNEALADARAERASAPHPTTALLDGSAADRRLDRMERRLAARPVTGGRSSTRPDAAPDGEEAA